MIVNYRIHLFLTACIFFCILRVKSQQTNDSVPGSQTVSQKNNLFKTDQPLDLTLEGDVNALLGDRTGEAKNHPFQLEYPGEDSMMVSVPIEAKTRGNFRRQSENCYYPPILLSFPKGGPKTSSLFKKYNQLKLVMPCKGDQYIIYEWLAYRLYNIITPQSFRARLVRIKLVNAKNNKSSKTFYGMLLEGEKQMAKRNGAIPVKRQLRPEQAEASSFLTMSVFEYLIGNTDWSVQFMHNVKLIADDSHSSAKVVPYDFDMSGIVNTPYARPAEELKMYSVRQRRYRGYCMENMQYYDQVLGLFNRKKTEIYALYANCPLLEARYIRSTTSFLDDFYKTINDKELVKKEFQYPCDKNGTGNVVIKGMSK